MSNQPHDPYGRQRPPEQEWPTGQQEWPTGQPQWPNGEQHGATRDESQLTQTWQTQTWETRFQPPVNAAEETAYLPKPPAAHPAAPGGPATPPPAPGQNGGVTGQQPHGGGYGYGEAHGTYGDQGAHGTQGAQATHGAHGTHGTHGAPAHPQPAHPQPSYGGTPPAPSQPQPPYGTPQTYGGGPGTGAGTGAHRAPQPPLQPQPPAYSHGYPGNAEPLGAPGPGPAPVPAASVPPAAASTAAPEPGFGPPTLTGNARVTDAQRARAEGRSPIIEPGVQPAGLTAVLALLMCGGAALGQYALLVPLVLLQAVTAAGWFRLNGMWPARQGIALAFLGGFVADLALLAAGRDNGPAAILGSLGVWVLLSVTLQLRSHASPDERLYGLTATIVSAALAILAAGHLAAPPHAVEAGGVAVALAVLVRALPLPTAASVAVALIAAAGAGALLGSLNGLGSGGALVGLGAGLCAVIGHRVASYDYPSRFVHMTAGVALPLAAAAPAVYLLGRLVG
ncbi:hypothetical protein [Streptomyces sp. NPDC007088]|uniref:hypothetical protein n=1 Tax=Streptomyces sp. NPDC007088 TaxID=3364773 RepID=UPI0036B87E0C